MQAVSVQHNRIRQPCRWFALFVAVVLLCLCARYYPVWVVNSFYHPGAPNSGLLLACAVLFLAGAYLLLVAVLGRWTPGPEASMARKTALAASAILVSLLAVAGVLAWDFRGP